MRRYKKMVHKERRERIGVRKTKQAWRQIEGQTSAPTPVRIRVVTKKMANALDKTCTCGVSFKKYDKFIKHYKWCNGKGGRCEQIQGAKFDALAKELEETARREGVESTLGEEEFLR